MTTLWADMAGSACSAAVTTAGMTASASATVSAAMSSPAAATVGKSGCGKAKGKRQQGERRDDAAGTMRWAHPCLPLLLRADEYRSHHLIRRVRWAGSPRKNRKRYLAICPRALTGSLAYFSGSPGSAYGRNSRSAVFSPGLTVMVLSSEFTPKKSLPSFLSFGFGGTTVTMFTPR